MAELVALDLPGGSAFVDALRRVWERGDAVFPIDQRLPRAARARVLAAIAPTRVVDTAGERGADGGRPVEPGDAVVVATSGTSGDPKGVVLTHDAVRASARATSARLSVDSGRDRWLACLPLAHVGGLSVVMRALLTDTPIEVLPAFDVASVEEAARRGATLVSLVGTALGRVDASLFRTVVLGGARPPDVLPANVVTTYGMTETGSGVVYDGHPLDGIDVRIEAGGQIHLRGPMLLRGYRDGTVPLDAEGWLATGDIGRWEGERLVVEGRLGDLIITGGENVWPEAVEEVLRAEPGVADVAVAGRPDDEWGQVVVAYVVARDSAAPPSLDALRGAVRSALPAYCAPRRVVLVAAIPRTALGKPRRALLP